MEGKDCTWIQFYHSGQVAMMRPIMVTDHTKRNITDSAPMRNRSLKTLLFGCILVPVPTEAQNYFTSPAVSTWLTQIVQNCWKSKLKEKLCGKWQKLFWGAWLSNHALQSIDVSVHSAPHHKVPEKINDFLRFYPMHALVNGVRWVWRAQLSNHALHTCVFELALTIRIMVMLAPTATSAPLHGKYVSFPAIDPRGPTTIQVLIEINFKKYCMLKKAMEREKDVQDVETGTETLYEERKSPSSCPLSDCCALFDVWSPEKNYLTLCSLIAIFGQTTLLPLHRFPLSFSCHFLEAALSVIAALILGLVFMAVRCTSRAGKGCGQSRAMRR